MVRGAQKHVVAYLRDFLFDERQALMPVSRLSGGERARLLLARLFAAPSNLLVMDEPTNDLDLETLDLLEEVLDDYDGTVLLVSHDRDFLDRLVTSVIVMAGDGSAVEHAGRLFAICRGPQAPEIRPGRIRRRKPRRRARGPARPSASAIKEQRELDGLPARDRPAAWPSSRRLENGAGRSRPLWPRPGRLRGQGRPPRRGEAGADRGRGALARAGA